MLSQIRSGGVASIKGIIINIDTQLPVEGVSVYAKEQGYSAVSDANGVFNITQVVADTYIFNFEKTGFEPTILTIDVKTGTAARVDIALKAIEFALKVA